MHQAAQEREVFEAHTDDIILIGQWLAKSIDVLETWQGCWSYLKKTCSPADYCAVIYSLFNRIYLFCSLVMTLLASLPPATESCLEAKASLMSTRWEKMLHAPFMIITSLFTYWGRKNMLTVMMKLCSHQAHFLAFDVSNFRSSTPKRKAGKRNT